MREGENPLRTRRIVQSKPCWGFHWTRRELSIWNRSWKDLCEEIGEKASIGRPAGASKELLDLKAVREGEGRLLLNGHPMVIPLLVICLLCGRVQRKQ